MKKITSVLLAVLMLFSMFAVSASAAGYDKVTVSVSQTQANVGDVIKVTVGVKANSNLVTFEGSLTYDTAYFQYVDGSAKTYGAINGFEELNATAGKVKYVGATGTKVTAAGTICTFELKVLKTGGTLNFVVDEAYIINAEGQDEAVSIASASITIKAAPVECKHPNTEKVKVEPTCTKDGYEVVKCKDCKKELSKSTIKSTGHKMGNYKVTKEATCSQEGSSEATCSVCGYKDVQKLSKTAHKFGAFTVTKEATCTSEGTKTAKCSVCGETKKETISKKAHDFDLTKEKVTKEATCTEDGAKQNLCKTCNKYINNGTIPAKGHEFAEGSERTEPTCTTPGKEVGKCKNCNEEGAETIIPATGHTYGEWVEKEAATTKKEGKEQRTCETCGEVEERAIEKLPKKDKATEEEETEEKEFPLVLVICIGGGVAALAVLALVIVMILRKKKTNVE